MSLFRRALSGPGILLASLPWHARAPVAGIGPYYHGFVPNASPGADGPYPRPPANPGYIGILLHTPGAGRTSLAIVRASQ